MKKIIIFAILVGTAFLLLETPFISIVRKNILQLIELRNENLPAK